MLVISIQQASKLNERRNILRRHVTGQGEAYGVCAVSHCSCHLFSVLWRFFCTLDFLALLPDIDYRTESDFTDDFTTYFLFLVRGLVSYQDEGKCQDEGSAGCGPVGCQIK